MNNIEDMIYFNSRREENYPVIKLGIRLNFENRDKVKEIFANLLGKNKRWFRMDLDSPYRRLFTIDSMISKINRRHRKEFREITMNILINLGCSEFVLEKGEFAEYFICKTPFGERKIEILKFAVDADRDNIFDDYTVGVRFTGYKIPSVLDFKSVSGGVENIICEDYTKHFPMFKEFLEKITPLFSNLEIGIMNGR